MLIIRQDVLLLKVVDDAGVHDMFSDFAAD